MAKLAIREAGNVEEHTDPSESSEYSPPQVVIRSDLYCKLALWLLRGKKNIKILQEIKIELPCAIAILLLGMYSKEMKTFYEEISAPHVQWSIIYNSQDMGTT